MFICKEKLHTIYSIYLLNGGSIAENIETEILQNPKDFIASVDDIRNEREIYNDLFQTPCISLIESIFHLNFNSMSSKPYEQCKSFIDALAFIQDIAASAMWKFDLSIPGDLEAFVRDFDRLDVPEERYRLYQLAQQDTHKKTT
ncbi:hypothetical protein [Ralstonia mojiangensis]|uniref:hypothetical protein n=1 Tax=Ralstonia mojiangensis TaxID=2953895 RepID=UPI0021B279E0|nr:hypothetical protein [Ralstonia mojiangensis]MCT7329676.1 hypothetical protein [Ralstonia mojiangensis]